MTGSPRFFSTSTVRTTTNIIAKLNFWISLVQLINIIRTIHPVSDIRCSRQTGQTTWFLNETSIDRDQLQYEHIFSLLSMLFIVVLMVYVNFYLSLATSEHEVYRVHQWLVIYTIIFVFSLVFLVVPAFIIPNIGRFLFGIVITLFEAFGLYVVRIFYHDEIEYVQAVQNRAAVSAVHSYASQTSSAPPLNCAVQAGQPYVIQRVQQPDQQQAAYPQVIVPMPQQQHPEPHMPVPVPPPHDFSKPPPYSP
ncbi:uncharacterized protein LOC126847916 [Adelges cooleyi]|uniref:uncharacterized protein LOC126847916 n=1 Tax=Adelges cooleyi TaxID=133065 RepID=UPI00217FAD8D|nr:uncharacterized protein LOC126847916 [Adelges cooleyi]